MTVGVGGGGGGGDPKHRADSTEPTRHPPWARQQGASCARARARTPIPCVGPVPCGRRAWPAAARIEGRRNGGARARAVARPHHDDEEGDGELERGGLVREADHLLALAEARARDRLPAGRRRRLAEVGDDGVAQGLGAEVVLAPRVVAALDGLDQERLVGFAALVGWLRRVGRRRGLAGDGWQQGHAVVSPQARPTDAELVQDP